MASCDISMARCQAKMRNSPIRKKTRALCRTKSNSSLDGISLVPFAVCSDFDLRYWNSNNRLGSSFSETPTAKAGVEHQAAATAVKGVYPHQLTSRGPGIH